MVRAVGAVPVRVCGAEVRDEPVKVQLRPSPHRVPNALRHHCRYNEEGRRFWASHDCILAREELFKEDTLRTEHPTLACGGHTLIRREIGREVGALCERVDVHGQVAHAARWGCAGGDMHV